MAPAAAHAFVADLGSPQLSPDDHHHLMRVMRLRPGQAVTVSDGEGRWRPCRVTSDGLEPDGDIATVAAPSPPVSVAFALTKGVKPEWTVQKLTEVGVDVIIPLMAERSVVRWDESKAARQVSRWQEVARQAAMQSRRVRLPVVEDAAPFADVASRPGAALAQPGGGEPSLSHPLMLTGPEGGWSAAELGRDLPLVDLGGTVLRAETAALVAGIRLCALRAR